LKFDKYCPGKSKSKGYAKMREALKYASNILGTQNTYTILISGVDNSKSFIDGIKSILDDGVTPTLNIYHHDPLSAPNMDVSEPNIEELIFMFQEISSIFQTYNVKPGSLGCAHYDIGHEIQRGFLNVG
jgi:hypothetical protein